MLCETRSSSSKAIALGVHLERRSFSCSVGAPDSSDGRLLLERRKQRLWKQGLAALLLLAVAAYGLSSPTWQHESRTPKSGGIGQAVCGAAASLFVIRGYSTGRCQFWEYDSSVGVWRVLTEWTPPKSEPATPIPRPKSGTALAWDGEDRIYALFGGAGSDARRVLFYVYEISTNRWLRLADSPHAQGAGNALTWCGSDSSLYALLGSDKRGSSFARYAPATDSWQLLALNPSWVCTDDGASLAWGGGRYIYALSGEWEDAGPPHTDFAQYDREEDQWQDLAPIPESDSYGGSAGVGDGGSLLWIGNWDSEEVDCVYALGGGGYREDPGYAFYRYRIPQDEWERLTDIPCPVGEWVGSRLGYAGGSIYCWQGNKSSATCGGAVLLKWVP